MTTYTVSIPCVKFDNTHSVGLDDGDVLEVQGYFEGDFFQIDSINWITSDNNISNDLVNIVHDDTLAAIREAVSTQVADDYENQQALDFDNAYQNYRDNRMVEDHV
jgi:hypothetical protein